MEPTTRYCPTCNALRTPEQQQGGFCVVCGTDLREEEGSGEPAPAPRPDRWDGAEDESSLAEAPRPEESSAPEPVQRPETRTGTERTGRTRPATEPIEPAERAGAAPPAARPAGPGEDHPAGQDTLRGSWETPRPVRPQPVRPQPPGPEPAGATQAGEPAAREPLQPARSRPAVAEAPDLAEPQPSEPRRSTIPPPPPPPPPAAGAASPAAGTTTVASAEPDARQAGFDQVVARIGEHLDQGYEPFGLVGLAGSGKTHFLKALTPLLAKHSIGGQRATLAFQSAEIPGPTAYRVFDYAYEGPGGKFVMLDAGGELFRLIQTNDWKASMEDRGVLGRWLHRCRGLFCFLHLDAYHFGKLPPEVDPGRDPAEVRRGHEQKMLQARQELEFFKYFLLFLRGLRAEGGDFDALVARCRDQDSLDAALRPYQQTPLLDLPVMFYFTQADGYRRQDVEVRPGLYLDPRRLPVPPHLFAARYLPTLFGGVVSQVRRFKFDFLQSYETHPTGQRDAQGEPIVETFLEAPEDPTQLLSAGLLSGVEFVLRNTPRQSGAAGGRKRPTLPQLDSRRALLLHRLLHPRQWEGVPRNLLGSWRSPRRTTP